MPDSSIMLELCRILGISVNELLSGEKIEMENITKRADETLLELKRKDENNLNKNTVISIIFTVTMIMGIMVCCICDIATMGTMTWSLITLSAILFAWIISFPIILLGKRGILGGMLSLSIFIIPFLYVMSVLIKNMAIFRIGWILSILTLIYIWTVYGVYSRFRNRKMLATGITFFLSIPFMFFVNMTLSKMLAEPMAAMWNIVSAFVLLVIAFSFMVGDYAYNRDLTK